jgi:cytoplasmic iron level regulating protein YaaA (DUF328/UPF0246 family)
MLLLLSPAKSLDFNSPVAEGGTMPRFATDAASIAKAAAKLGPERLQQIMHISRNLAELNADRFRSFAEAEERPAIRAFAGDVYRGFDAASANDDVMAFAQEHVRILSGLYGLLLPLDRIRPYRLEMGTRWAPKGGKLVDHWDGQIARAVLADLDEEGSGILLNLASNEYFAAVGPHLPSDLRLISPRFKVRTAKGLQFQSFIAKVARGAMARWVCEERIADPEALASFDSDGWAFDAEGSTEAEPLFVRG